MKKIIITESTFKDLIEKLVLKILDKRIEKTGGSNEKLLKLKELLLAKFEGLDDSEVSSVSGKRMSIKNPGVAIKSYPSNLSEKLKSAVGNSVYNQFIDDLESIGLDPVIALRQLYSESGFSGDVITCKRKSSAGAQGIAQFMPSTWTSYGTGSPCDPKQALKAYIKLMKKLMEMFPNRIDLALAGYNSGPHRTEYKNALKDKKSFSSLKGKIPNETYSYVSSILQP